MIIPTSLFIAFILHSMMLATIHGCKKENLLFTFYCIYFAFNDASDYPWMQERESPLQVLGSAVALKNCRAQKPFFRLRFCPSVTHVSLCLSYSDSRDPVTLCGKCDQKDPGGEKKKKKKEKKVKKRHKKKDKKK